MSNSRQSPILDLVRAKATLGACDGCETPARFDSLQQEYQRLRQGIGLLDANHYGKFQVQGPAALEVVNQMVIGDVSRLPINRLLASFALKADGSLLCDAYVFNQGDSYLLLTEGALPSAVLPVLEQEAKARKATVVDLTESMGLLSLDGPFAWEILKELIGVKILGMKYLGALTDQTIAGASTTLFRAGKTGEFGYLLKHSVQDSPALWNKLLEAGKDFDLQPCGSESLDLCKLENRFVNMKREGRLARTILELNGRILIGKDKESYRGSEATRAALAAGPQRRLVGLTLDGTADALPSPGSELQYKGTRIGELVNAGYSFSLGKAIGVAFLDVAYAYAGLDYTLRTGGRDQPVRTVSAPFILNRSTTIRPQEDSYRR